MATVDGHIDSRSENTDNEVASFATVIRVRAESKTVKGLTLKVHNKCLSFKAGQWLDMKIPGVERVGGYSMCSSPKRLETHQELDLAVKQSDHPPTHWVHTQCKEGCEVHIRISGDFYYDGTSLTDDILLLAGGVGINTLYSIINHVVAMETKGDNKSDGQGRLLLLYCASSHDELIFKDSLDQIAATHPSIRCQYYVTREGPVYGSNSVLFRRIESCDVTKVFDWLRKERTVVYNCGPSPMITAMQDILVSQGVPEDRIHYEKWWKPKP